MITTTALKTADTQHDVHDLIRQRWSARSFSDRNIDEAQLEKLFEAAAWTASSMNEQPWKFLYAHRGTQGFTKMTDCLMEGNAVWAKDGAVMILALAKKNFDRNGKPNRHAMHDVGAANTTLLLQAAADDIFGHMMGGFHMQETIEGFDIDTDQWEPACFIVIGYLDEAEKLEEPFRSRELAPRSRKPISAFTQAI